jgi:hypothetical protein
MIMINSTIKGVPWRYRIKSVIIKYSSVFRWILAIIVLAFPPIYLAFRPQDYTPLVETLLGVILFYLAYWIGFTKEIEMAAQRANDRWLPQAESVIFRLMTLHANVRKFSHITKIGCMKSQCDLPELTKPELRPIRIKMKAECEASGQRLDDIANQLDDAIEDWRRFVAANCMGDECGRIFDALEQRRTKLEQEIEELTKSFPH